MIVDIFIVFIWQAERSERKGEHFEPVEDLSRANHSREYFMFPRLVKIGFCTSMFDKNERATGNRSTAMLYPQYKPKPATTLSALSHVDTSFA
jgi:hypothetical protein